MCGDFYDFFRDQGSLMAGGLAIVAALIANHGARKAAQLQVDAVERQNVQLKNGNRRALARRGIVAANLLFGVLKKIEDDIKKIDKLLDQPQFFASREAAPPSWRKLIHRPSLTVVWQELGLLGQEFVKIYLILDAKIADFAEHEINGVDYMKNMLAEMSNLVAALLRELELESKRSYEILADGEIEFV